MSGWDLYTQRMDATAPSKREMWVKHDRESIRRRMMDSPGLKPVTINGVRQLIAVRHRTEANEKRIAALPGEHLAPGGLVEFSGGKWLITEVDIDNEVYERGLMKRCNNQLRWINKSGELIERWVVVEDGTKYLIGEHASEIMQIGDARIGITLGKDPETVELDRGIRFIVDDIDTKYPMAYQVTKPNRFFGNYVENGGVFRFILNEVVRTINDDIENRIADLRNWMPPRPSDGDFPPVDQTVAEIVSNIKERVENNPPTDDKERWI